MTMIEKARPRAVELRGDLQRWLRSVIPIVTWSARRRSRAPQVFGALALVGLGAVTALYLAPVEGRELRARTRKGAQRLRRRARELVERAGAYRSERAHAHPLERERARRSEAASS